MKGPKRLEDKVELLCRRFGFEFLKDQTTFCGVDKPCLYKSDESFKGEYRCMMLEKRDLWKFDYERYRERYEK